jgi:hypothetical protein
MSEVVRIQYIRATTYSLPLGTSDATSQRTRQRSRTNCRKKRYRATDEKDEDNRRPA